MQTLFSLRQHGTSLLSVFRFCALQAQKAKHKEDKVPLRRLPPGHRVTDAIESSAYETIN
jgi:hypothetical protein